jgi:hypothetical protein
MTFILDRLHAATEAPKRPVTFLPARLDASACVDILDRIHVPVQIAAATGQPLDIRDVDKALSATPLSVSDRIRFKQALTASGLLSRSGKAA